MIKILSVFTILILFSGTISGTFSQLSEVDKINQEAVKLFTEKKYIESLSKSESALEIEPQNKDAIEGKEKTIDKRLIATSRLVIMMTSKY